MELTRRAVLSAGVAMSCAASSSTQAAAVDPQKIGIFSRNLQWMSAQEAIGIAKEIGFGSMEWSVRPASHIEPANVERDLPAVVEASRKAGLSVDMLSANLLDGADPMAERILKTAASLRIPLVRGAAAYTWQGDANRGQQYEEIKRKIARLAEVCARHGVAVALHTYSTPNALGGNLYDLLPALEAISPEQVGFNYDMTHVTARNGAIAWRDALLTARSKVLAISVKDFLWVKGPRGWTTEWKTFGQGMVDLPGHFKLLRETQFTGPIILQVEHDGLLGPAVGQGGPPVPRDEFVRLLRADLSTTRAAMAAG